MAILALSIAGCSSAASSAPNTTVGPNTSGSSSASQFQNYIACVDDITGNLDPAQASDQPGFQFMRATYETLVNYDPVKAQLVGALADSWQASPDATVYTLHLRPNVTFHDGSSLTASGVKASLDRTLAIGKGESSLIGDIQTVDVVDPSTIKITLKAPDADLLFNLTRIFIVSAQAIQAHTTSADPNAAQWFSQNEDGSGPYK
ncbi:MAG: ABC transporter substrate-binding protein, partial [Candidatus Limnocylindrales bacterium]